MKVYRNCKPFPNIMWWVLLDDVGFAFHVDGVVDSTQDSHFIPLRDLRIALETKDQWELIYST
jgi:hypothetical protein